MKLQSLLARIEVSFSSKVLVPTVGAMMLLLAITVWVVNRRITQQVQTEGTRALMTADAVFQNSQKIFTRSLLRQFQNLPNEPRYKATFQEAHPPTIKNLLQDLLGEQGVDVVLYTTAEGELVASAKRSDLLVPLTEFETNSLRAVKHALAGDQQVDTIRAGDRLFNVVSIPVLGTSERLIGALTLGSEIGDSTAQEFSLLTHSQIVLLAHGRIIASTVPNSEARPEFARLFSQCGAGANQPARPIAVVLGDEHYFCAAGHFPSLSGSGNLGYLLLTSYEQAFQALRSTQQALLVVCSLGILLGTAVVWFLVRKATQPLRALRDSAEAVGRGDFSRRVQVQSRDECGELARVFNQMTENLKSSREQLEMTVDTLKTTQAQLIQSEKLSGIGEFVAGVAHELNNPLTSVMGFSELLKRADQDPQHQRFLEMIHKSALRCQKIVQSLLSFARRHQPERKLASLNELIEGAVEILQYQMRTGNIEVTTRLDRELPKAMVDSHQVQQVFLNIINNARQAIEAHRPAGWVRITSERQGDRARVIFEDSGPGIPEQNLLKVFDPFFTTKDVGKGTGLGLSLCYGIIREHGGTITVRSKPGEGATFVIELPLVMNPDAAEQGSPPAAGTGGNLSEMLAPSPRDGAGKKVLVIDDEEPILQMVSEALAEHGYQVDTAADGETGLRRLTQTRYDLALCDWKMPGLNGQQVYERLRTTNPALSERLIFITGDVINDKAQSFLRDCKKVCLTKPFSLDEFRVAVSKALAA